MTGKKIDVHLNGTTSFVTIKDYAGPVRLWEKLQLNEWTFSFILFVLSLSIVLGKLFVNYGNFLQLQNSGKYTISTTSVLSSTSDTFGISSIPILSEFNIKRLGDTSEKFVNISSHYEDVVANAVTSFFKTYGWLIRAAISGLIMMGFTWFIIYKDSNIPGINPPSPFSPSKRRLPEASRVQMNYLVGVLNGILIFVYMCL